MSNMNEHVSPELLGSSINDDSGWLSRPGWLLIGCFLLAALGMAGITGVVKDSSVDAFVSDDHPAALARDRALDIFGLEDPIVVGLVAQDGGSVFTPQALTALRDIQLAIRLLPNVDKNGLVSVATENSIEGDELELRVDSILEDGPVTEQTAQLAWERVNRMPMMLDLLASRDGSVITLIVPVGDPNHARATYVAIKEAAEAAVPPGVEAHVAGVAAMNARLAFMVDTDTRIFVPAAVVVVLLTLLIALRRPGALLGPLFVIAASAGIAVGVMGWVGGRYYLITTALPVVVMAISVADSLHLITFFLKYRSENHGIDATTAVRAALRDTWLPITLTSITTVAAFVGMSLSTDMIPIREFGFFASAGVGAAWALSLTALPAILILTNLQPRESNNPSKAPAIDSLLRAITQISLRRPISVLAVTIAVVTVMGLFAQDARFDYERKRYFQSDDPVLAADTVLNERLGGLNFLDVVVSSPEEFGLMTPESLAAIASLSEQMSQLPMVNKVSGIHDYIAIMHQSLTGAEAGELPTKERAPGQYMFLYETSGSPDDFKQEINYQHQQALVRAQLTSDRFSTSSETVKKLRSLAETWSRETGLRAEVGGRVAVNEGWMEQLSSSHFRGLGVAVLFVFISTVIAFRSVPFALFALIPVGTGVLFIYALMGLLAIDIAPATSMVAAISTGLGIDFGVHLISHIRNKRRQGDSLVVATSGSYLHVSRACFYSSISLTAALLVVCLSSAPPLRWFGSLVAVGALGSLIGALFIVPSVMSFVDNVKQRRIVSE